MLRRRRAIWSSNEYFAHKKNVGEEVKLRYAMSIIEKSYGLTKGLMKDQVSETRTSLRNLRKSTGHSIDALPPTPFQNHGGKGDDLSRLPREVTFSELPPEYRYLEIETASPINEIAGVLKASDVSQDARLTHALACGQNNNESIGRSVSVADDESPKSENGQKQQDGEDLGRDKLPCVDDAKCDQVSRSVKNSGDRKQEEEKPKSQMDLPPINSSSIGPHHESEDSNPKPKSKLDSYQPSEPLPAKIIQDVEDQPRGSITDSIDVLIPSYLCSKPKYRLDSIYVFPTENTFEENDHNSMATPMSSVVTSGKVREPGHVATFLDRQESNALLQRRKDAQRKKKETHNNLSMRDIRTRCRTCLERFRENKEFERLKKKKEQEEEHQRHKNNFSSGRNVWLRDSRHFTLAVEDVEFLLSDQVLDFCDVDNQPAWRKSHRAKKGYSRKRMDQLAQPRAKRKRKLLFSKHLIKKEVDTLIESHSRPELTEKEKERLRMLESKIRMFFAMMQDSGTPSIMVHIPQREDIMKVDISHL